MKCTPRRTCTSCCGRLEKETEDGTHERMQSVIAKRHDVDTYVASMAMRARDGRRARLAGRADMHTFSVAAIVVAGALVDTHAGVLVAHGVRRALATACLVVRQKRRDLVRG